MATFDLNIFTQYFDNPKVSVFNRSSKKGFDMRIGKWYPSSWDLLSFGNSNKCSSGHKLRLAPLLAPNFTDLNLQEHTIVVPLRVIMSDYENVFNFAVNKDGASLPHINIYDYKRLLQAMVKVGINPIGSLLDFLGYPVYADVFQALIKDSEFSTRDLQSLDDVYDIYYLPQSSAVELSTVQGFYRYRSVDRYVSDILIKPFFNWLSDVSGFNSPAAFTEAAENLVAVGNDFETAYIKSSIYETMQSAVEAYQLYFFGRAIDVLLSDDEDGTYNFTTLPLRAYWRAHFDWNINGNFVNRDEFLNRYVFNFENNLNDTVRLILNDGNPSYSLASFISLQNRLWDYDPFTTLLPTAAVDNAIEIPANSTILDLAGLTAFQRLVMKLSFSSRYRDVIWNIFKIKPSDARLVQSSVIRQKTHRLGIGETLQTSESSVSSVLGSFAGRGYSSGLNKGYHIFAEEPSVVINFVSLVPEVSYADCLHPLIKTDDIFDFPIPDMDVLGLQPLTADFLSGSVEDRDQILGFGRQYYPWLYNFNTVHGQFKTSLDYWQLTRRFTETPYINDEFLRMSDSDDFDAIFSIPGASHAFIDIYYNNRVSRHVSRSLRIQI